MRRLVLLAIPLLIAPACANGHRRAAAARPIRVPNVIGLSWPEAAGRLGVAGLCYRWGRLADAPLSGTQVGRVFAQHPRPNGLVARRTRVRIDVAQRIPQGVTTFPLYSIDQDPNCPDPSVPDFVG